MAPLIYFVLVDILHAIRLLCYGSAQGKMTKNYLKFSASILGSVFLALNFIQPAFAANFTVTKITDTNDGVCDSDCSLREAIGATNALPGADTITVPAGTYTLTIAGSGEDLNATGDLDITGDLTINGAGNTSTTIDGGGIDRVFEVRPGATAQINAVTIQNGNSSGILNRGVLTINNSTVTNNSIATFGGGGIFNTATGTLTVTDSTISNNNANSPDLSHGGGGIYSDSGGPITLNRTTISGNTTTGRGGGILGQDPTISIINSTISTNTALNGGGVFNRGGTVNFTNTTIANNIATDNGGGVWNHSGTMNLKNTILTSNTAATASDDCAGSKTSFGYNIASDASCALGGTGDLNSTNPMIGSLAANGGPAKTHALLPTSPAIDLVPLSSCTVSTDQRGVPRPQGVACDSGSFEHPPTLPQQCAGNLSGYNLIQGTNGNDTLTGTAGQDLIFGYGGNDTINGSSGEDCLVGGLGKDLVFGSSGDDVILGGDGSDNLKGGAGDDYLDGGIGNDTMVGGSGDDDLRGSLGDDDIKGDSGSDMIDGQAGANDKANGGTGTDSCNAENETNCEI